MKISFITTVYNEEKTITPFLKSLLGQNMSPDEVVIVDGGSKDKTIQLIKSSVNKFDEKKIKLRIYSRRGNRSVGRNLAIKKASYEIIACSDAGNILDKNWLKEIASEFRRKDVDVVAGYYKGRAENIFQKSLVPYVLVMEDKIDIDNFLPATRSIAFRRRVWDRVGKFDESLSHNEDYDFALKLRENKIKIVFKKEAVVNWIPRKNIMSSFIMFFRFALGDAEAGIMRGKVLLLYARYLLFAYLLLLSIIYKSYIGYGILVGIAGIYVGWAIWKNYRYVRQKKSFFYLPLIQITADLAVLLGTSVGLLKRLKKFSFLRWGRKNKFLVLLTVLYLAICLPTLRWGSPNATHPFPYHMDEWHQLQSVRAAIAFGTINIEGAANGVLFHFLHSSFYLAPFALMGFIDPFVIEISDYINRQRTFDLLRINTLLYGVAAIVLMYYTLRQIKGNVTIALPFLVISPIWIALSGYFKYDIALFFWIILTLFFIIRYAHSPTRKSFLIVSTLAGLTASVKVSAIPILGVPLLGYVLFTKRRKFNDILLGVITTCSVFILFGMPDMVFGKGNTLGLFIENLIIGPEMSNNYSIGNNWFIYTYFKQLPLILGYGTIAVFLMLLFYWLFRFLKSHKLNFDNKLIVFLLISLVIFFVSLVPLKISAVGNRMLVLLPFIIILIGFLYAKLKITRFFTLFFISIFMLQCIQTFAWIYPKYAESPQIQSSRWIEANIEKGALIGIENIPIYQLLPNVIQKEFYYELYRNGKDNTYRYVVVDPNKKMPEYVIITNGEIEKNIFISTPKKSLVALIEKSDHKKKSFDAALQYFEFFGSKEDFYIANIVTLPTSVTVYQLTK